MRGDGEEKWERAKRYPLLRLLPEGPIRGGPTNMAVRCPLHEDSRPSLSIREKSDGTWVWFCQAGCGSGSVVDLHARMRHISPGQAVDELAGDEAIPPPPPPQAKERGLFHLVCNHCGAMDKPVRASEVLNRVELLEAMGWYIFPNRGPMVGADSYCSRCAWPALCYAAGIMIDGGVIPGDGAPSEWVRIARAG